MSSAASKATAALLCGVAFGALVLAVVGMPTTTIAGQLQLAQTQSSGLAERDTLIWIAGVGVAGVIVVALATRLNARHGRGATP